MKVYVIYHLFALLSPSPCPRSPPLATLFSWSLRSLFLVVDILRSPKALTSSALLAAPPTFIIWSSILFKYCYYGPRIDPGLAILIHPMKSAGGKPTCFIMYKAIREPVLPSPALQWTAIAPFSASQALKN